MIVCLNYAFADRKVQRAGKWAVTEQQYSEAKYPTYCNGAGIIFTRKGREKEPSFDKSKSLQILLNLSYMPKFWTRSAAEKILMESAKTRSFVIDDVFISGVLRRKTNISIYHNKAIFMGNVEWQLKYLYQAEASIQAERAKNEYLKNHAG